MQQEKARTGADAEAPLVNERAELERLRRENQELRRDNEFLGKAAAFTGVCWDNAPAESF